MVLPFRRRVCSQNLTPFPLFFRSRCTHPYYLINPFAMGIFLNFFSLHFAKRKLMDRVCMCTFFLKSFLLIFLFARRIATNVAPNKFNYTLRTQQRLTENHRHNKGNQQKQNKKANEEKKNSINRLNISQTYEKGKFHRENEKRRVRVLCLHFEQQSMMNVKYCLQHNEYLIFKFSLCVCVLFKGAHILI